MLHGYPEDTQLGRVLVLGLGASGKATVNYLIGLLGRRVSCIVVYGGASSATAEDFVQQTQAKLANHCKGAVPQASLEFIFDTEVVCGSFDLCIVSPGISEFSDFYRSALSAAAELISEVEFAWRESRSDSVWVAITGTNGKTTTTALAAHLLQQAGLAVVACGNIGQACIEAVAQGCYEVYVAEVSSYQLASTKKFAPKVAALLNITPDHVKWHRSFEAYAQAKYKLLANLASVAQSVAVLDATNEVVRTAQVKPLRRLSYAERGFDYIPVGSAQGLASNMQEMCGSDNAAWLNEGELTVSFRGTTHQLVGKDELLIPGEHNCNNALIAVSIAVALGVSDETIRGALTSFSSLEHRIEACGSVRGVRCYNDSKATNVDATLKAFEAFEAHKALVLLGGEDKGTPLDKLVARARACCKAVVCFGAARQRFLTAFEEAERKEASQLKLLSAHHLEDALDVALEAAVPGDVVILSPACASFDEFSSFEHRGNTFKQLVARRQEQKGA